MEAIVYQDKVVLNVNDCLEPLPSPAVGSADPSQLRCDPWPQSESPAESVDDMLKYASSGV